MQKYIYCAHCEAALMEHKIAEKQMLLCPICGAMYERVDDRYRYSGSLSGGNAIRELIGTLEGGEQNGMVLREKCTHGAEQHHA